MVYDFALIKNTDNFNTVNKVTGKDSGYYAGGIGVDSGGGRSTDWVQMQKAGQYNDFVTGSVRVRYVENVDDLQVFEIEHEFIINPWYLEGQESNLENNEIVELLKGNATLKHVSSSSFRFVLNNPNTDLILIDESNLGSVAWFNEAFNGFNNNYEIDSVSYAENISGTPSDGILLSGETKITVLVKNKTKDYGIGDYLGAYISFLPIESDYIDTVETNMIENFIYDNAISYISAGAKAGSDFIKDINISVESAAPYDMAKIEIIVEYSAEQQAFLNQRLKDSGANFLLGIQAGEQTLSNGNSDRVVLLADVNEYQKTADIPNLVFIDKFRMLPHNEILDTDEGYTDMISWDEDGLILDFRIVIDRNKEAFINSMRGALIAYNPITEEYFELNAYEFNLPQTVSNGIQQLDLESQRGIS